MERESLEIISLLSKANNNDEYDANLVVSILHEACEKYISLVNLKVKDIQGIKYRNLLNVYEGLLQMGNAMIMNFEVYIESLNSYDDDDTETYNRSNFIIKVGLIKILLSDVASLHQTTAVLIELKLTFIPQLNNPHEKLDLKGDDAATIADAYLDSTIACKRAQKNKACIDCNLKRIKFCPQYKITDAIRLLGLKSIEEEYIEEACEDGIFQSNQCQNDLTDLDTWCPSEKAFDLGEIARNIFLLSNYSLSNAVKILLRVLCNEEANLRFFSANSFFNHRHELLSKNNSDDYCIDVCLFDELPGSSATKVLTYLYLFGVALNRDMVVDALGNTQVKSLFDAKLLRLSPCNENDVVAECQIYPLHTNIFDVFIDETAYPLFFMTDWPIESLRIPRDAIMAVGYDSLELLALSSGTALFEPFDGTYTRILDLCCGCGIQGLFAAAHYMQNKTVTDIEDYELICMDINRRAKHFVTGNICLNGLSKRNSAFNSINFDISFVHADVYKPIVENGQQTPCIGHFNHIISNPPFVAIPKVIGPDSLSTALYSAGGGKDGLGLLRKILIECFQVLKQHPAASILIVTELPNIEDSCELVKSFLDKDHRDNKRIRIAYVEGDVETIDEYSREREDESGLNKTFRHWNLDPKSIRNRALVLMSVRNEENGECKLARFESHMCHEREDCDFDEADSEDSFLTKEGITFFREIIL